MRRYQQFIVLLTFLFSHCFLFASAQQSGLKSFEKQVQQVISKVSPACVKISRYDSTGHKRFGTFSGVVVTADGLVLTAAHATVTGESYLLELPDGKQYRGTALARIPVVDAAVIQVNSAGAGLPFCEVGWSYDLSVNQPCLSISYPGSLSQLTNPVVRLGCIMRTVTPEGKMQTSCLMEPGDSGGPVFDLLGRVIALHSKIEASLKVNLENPIDNYRKYWGLLKEQKDYPKDFYPDLTEVGIDPMEKRIRAVQPLIQVPGILASLKDGHRNTTVGIKSTMGSVDLSAWGSIISLQSDKKNKYVVSKSSIVGDHPVLYTAELKTIPAVVVKRDPDNDLVLLKAEDLTAAIVLPPTGPAMNKNKEGMFLISPSYMDSIRVGILGNDSAKVTAFSQPNLGLICKEQDSNTVTIIGFTAGVFQKYGLKTNDVIDSLNGVHITSIKQMYLNNRTMEPGQDAVFCVIRSGQKLRIHGLIDRMPKIMYKHIADTFDGGMSLRSEGFNHVFVHDSMIRPEECGGPVFDLNGNFYGINIARLSRTSTLALPYAVVRKFILDSVERPI
jgi:serine protease Do